MERGSVRPGFLETTIFMEQMGAPLRIHPTREEEMAFLKKLFWWKRSQPVQRIRVCIECGMPVGEHKDWCAILKGQQAMRERAAAAGS